MKTLFLIFLLVLPVFFLPALNLWRHPEAAEENAVFAGLTFAELASGTGFTGGKKSLRLYADWLLPVLLPLSAGAYLAAPDPNLKSFGLRLAWHIDIPDPRMDLYFLYVFDMGFLRNDILEEYGDEKQPFRKYDFRAGLRYGIGKYVFLCLETTHKLSGLAAGLSLKLH
jgi:hypothetical protein